MRSGLVLDIGLLKAGKLEKLKDIKGSSLTRRACKTVGSTESELFYFARPVSFCHDVCKKPSSSNTGNLDKPPLVLYALQLLSIISEWCVYYWRPLLTSDVIIVGER